MSNKKTVVEMFTEIMNVPGLSDEQRAFLARRIELTEKKNAKGASTPTKTQVANEGIKAVLIDVLTESNAPMSISDMQKNSAELAELSNQKLSALITQLINKGAGPVVRSEIKGKAHFALRSED